VLNGIDTPRQIAANCGNFSFPKATNCDKFVAAFCRFLPLEVRLRHFDLYDRKGMVSRKNRGFQVSESPQKSSLIERIKLHDDGCSIKRKLVALALEYS
jgi:hypothetical protein